MNNQMGSTPQRDSEFGPWIEEPGWRGAYKAALFEIDRSRIADKIRRAELAIIQRERELCPDGTASSERLALTNALHALRALRACLGLK